MSKVILIVAAHADDEVLGCGGTIARHTADGDIVHAVFIADGVSSRADADSIEIDRRHAAASKAHALLGIRTARYLGLPDNRLDTIPLLDIVRILEEIIIKISPEIIYTHHFGDLNVDHRITHQAVMTVCRPQPCFSVREIMTFEVMSSTEWAGFSQAQFNPNIFVNITDFVEAKELALQAYSYEMRAQPHSRSMEHIEALGRHRGNSCGMAFAEGFMLIRSLR